MPIDTVRKFKINNQEYLIKLDDINNGNYSFFLNLNNCIYDFVYEKKSLDSFKCYEVLNDNKIEIFNKDFIKNHLTNFFSIFDKVKFSGINPKEIIEYDNNKLIIINDSLSYFFEGSHEILYEINNYKITSVKLIYDEFCEKKIDYNRSYKKFVKLVKYNYDLLELIFLKLEIENLNLMINSLDDHDQIEELIAKINQLKKEYNLKLNSSLDSHNHDYQYYKNNRNNRFFSVVFNDSWCFNLAKKMINIVELSFYFYKIKPKISTFLITKISNGFLIPIIDLMFGITEFMAFEQFYEKKLEIDDERSKLLKILNDYQELNDHIISQENNLTFKFISKSTDFIFAYTIELAHFFTAEILNIFARLNFQFKRITLFA
jgi:hypothetical protein